MSLIPHRGVILPVKKHLPGIERKQRLHKNHGGENWKSEHAPGNSDKCAESLHITPTSLYLCSPPKSGKPPFKGEEGENTSATEPEWEDQEQECRLARHVRQKS
jgi:hypothetical protein